jgi:beta-galactosidase
MKAAITIILILIFQLVPVPAQSAEREATPAVVNPVERSRLRDTISLNGKWDFATDPDRKGETEKWFLPEKDLPEKTQINVPACWEAEGIGKPGLSSPAAMEQSQRPLRSLYVGTAWYRKEVAIPDAWNGKQVWLKIGGVNSEGTFWVNGTLLGKIYTYCGTYKYNVTDLVKPNEKAVIIAEVRNDVPSRKGVFNWIHRFGGLYRSVELEATGNYSIDYAYIEPFLDEKKVKAHITLRKAAGSSEGENIEVSVKALSSNEKIAGQSKATAKFGIEATSGLTIDVNLTPCTPWTPENPVLYKAEITLLRDGKEIDGWIERFGVRKLEVKDKHLYLNNQRFLVRGYGDDYVYPFTLCSPASREEHIKHLKIAKEFGFNYVRHHTHCELPEFFEAADEVGIMVQPELPYYGPKHGSHAEFTPKEDLLELITHYRRYVSLSTYCMGNEGNMGSPIDDELYKLAKETDPTRLVNHQDGGGNTATNSDFATIGGVLHEYLNLALLEDPRLTPKYTGIMMPPRSLDEFEKEVSTKGIPLDMALACFDAGFQLQRIYQKLGIENARLNPNGDGYIYWTIVDVGAPSAQGLFDQFWGVKRSKSGAFRQFNNPTAILIRSAPEKRIFTEDEEVGIDWWISHFGSEPIAKAKILWKITLSDVIGERERILDKGEADIVPIQLGEVKTLAKTKIIMPKIGEKAIKAALECSIPETDIRNSWDIWIFPKITAQPDAGKGIAASPAVYEKISARYPALTKFENPFDTKSNILITEALNSNILKAMSEGKSVLLLSLGSMVSVQPGVNLGWWGISPQSGTAIAKHPAFGNFPHEGYMDESFFRMVRDAITFTDDIRGVEPLMMGHGAWGYLVHVFQANVGKGKLLASGLDVLSDNSEAIYLLDQYIHYVSSDLFKPKGTLDIERIATRVKLLDDMNGWSQIVSSPDKTTNSTFLGQTRLHLVRQTDGKQTVSWKTMPVDKDTAKNETYTFRWIAATGWISQKAGGFALYLGDKELLKFDVVLDSAIWTSEDGKCRLEYTVMGANKEDSSGVMTLTVPSSFVVPGESAELRVVGSASQSSRWFAVCEYR